LKTGADGKVACAAGEFAREPFSTCEPEFRAGSPFCARFCESFSRAKLRVWQTKKRAICLRQDGIIYSFIGCLPKQSPVIAPRVLFLIEKNRTPEMFCFDYL